MRKFPCLTKNLSTIAGNSALFKFNCQLTSLTRSGDNRNAIKLFANIHRCKTLKPDQYSVSSAITAAGHLRDIIFGSQIHCFAIRTGLLRHSHVSNTLLSLYAKSEELASLKKSFREISEPDVYSWTTLLSSCFKLGDIEYAFKVFDEIPDIENVAIWNAIITGCKENSYSGTSIELFQEMHNLGVLHDKFSFATVLSICCLNLGKQVHSMVIKAGFSITPSVLNALITMYFNSQAILDAIQVFEEADSTVLDQVSFNAVIDGLADFKTDESFLVFKHMLETGLRPTDLTFVSLMSSCSCPMIGHQLHELAIKIGYEGHNLVSNSLITMYSSLEEINEAYKVFESLQEKDLVTWNTMISVYHHAGFGESAMVIYKRMQQEEVKPDKFTFGSLVANSMNLNCLEMIQVCVMKLGFSSKSELSNALISAYSKHGEIAKAEFIFERSRIKNLISWNGLISGFYQNGFPFKGLEKFSTLLESKFIPDVYTLSILLSICSKVSSLMLGEQIHAYVVRHEQFEEKLIGNSLMNMYSQCGLLQRTLKIFNLMNQKDIVSWNSMISAYARHGEGEIAVLCFHSMIRDHENVVLDPDSATFTAILSACSHGGLVKEGVEIFNLMIERYGFSPNLDHFSCLVDLLGRAGYLEDAEKLAKIGELRVGGFECNVWWSLFSSCVSYGDLKMGKMVAKVLIDRELNDSLVYVQLANIYAGAGLWKEAEETREAMEMSGALKQRGCSSWMRI